jgi:class 3 adenylate cyclase
MLISQTYHFEFDHPAEKLWSVVADTARWGEAVGLPKYQVREDLQEDGSVKVTGLIVVAGFTISWEEPPVDWIAGRWYEQRRINYRGPVPISAMTTTARLTDHGERSSLALELAFETTNFLGTFLARRLVRGYEKVIRQVLENADRLIRAERPELFVSNYQPTPTEIERGERFAAEIAETPYEHGLAARLVEDIRSTQEIDLWVMRPLAYARRWGVTAQQVIELFLQSVRSGLLESRWDILCPRCRVSKSTVANLSDLPEGVHCESCNIDFTSDFTRNVELNFSPSPAVREVEPGFFCRSGPNVTPHIKGQWTVAAHTRRELPLALDPGRYRLRTLEAGGEVEFDWSGGAFPGIQLADNHVGLADESPDGEIRLVNDGGLTRTVVVEEIDWTRDALTAEQVTTLQAFRDLFSDQVLRPGDEVGIRNIVFMFTDLVGSTGLYQELGDAGAYRVVREHFATLGSIVREHRGSIVKTVGDGVHAAFLHPEDALTAGIAIQRCMPDFNRDLGLHEVSIRIGLHGGSSIAVTLNDRLDYYGETVNLAARLEGQGEAGDITLTRELADDPAVASILRDYDVREQTVSMKGMNAPVSIRQLSISTPA